LVQDPHQRGISHKHSKQGSNKAYLEPLPRLQVYQALLFQLQLIYLQLHALVFDQFFIIVNLVAKQLLLFTKSLLEYSTALLLHLCNFGVQHHPLQSNHKPRGPLEAISATSPLSIKVQQHFRYRSKPLETSQLLSEPN
jgi:hypothetical protein